jgi:hypothetical protein
MIYSRKILAEVCPPASPKLPEKWEALKTPKTVPDILRKDGALMQGPEKRPQYY